MLQPQKDSYFSQTGLSDSLLKLKQCLDDFLEGTAKAVAFPYALAATGFAKEVLESAAAIPYGKTITYGELAQRSGHPRAARAVGQVLAHNPLPLFIPCQRIVLRKGYPGNYEFGTAAKLFLLHRERAQSDHS